MSKVAENKKHKNIYGWMMLVSLVFFACMHATFVGFTNDDSYFVILREEYDSLLELLKFRYLTDSSRVLSEAILFTLMKCPFVVWQILDVLICLLITHCLMVLLVDDKYSRNNIWVFLGFASYPFMHMGSAGWICTSLNYLWTFATLLYALVIVFYRKKGKKVSVLSYAAAVLSILYTANCEMPATALVMLFALALLYAVMEKRNCWYEICGCVLGLAGVIFALSAPGNDERTVMEAANWMPEFFDLSILEKARLCSVFVFEHFVAIPDVIFFLFALVLLLAGVRRKNQVWQNIMAALPLFIDVVFTGFYFVKDFLIGHKTSYDYSYPAIYMTTTYDKVLQLSEVAGLLLFILSSVYTIWRVLAEYEMQPQKEIQPGAKEESKEGSQEENKEGNKEGNKEEKLQEISGKKELKTAEKERKLHTKQDFWLRYLSGIWSIWMLGTGFAVRMALMLSPTMFSSWHRTLIFMYFAFLAVTFIIMFKCGLLEKKWIRRMLLIIFAIGIVINLILTVGLQIRKAGGYY